MQKIPFSAAQSEFTEKRSRFIGQVWPVSSEEEAQERIRSAKKKYHDARHNCWCYILGDNILRYSDDGEPQGTAGKPSFRNRLSAAGEKADHRPSAGGTI